VADTLDALDTVGRKNEPAWKATKSAAANGRLALPRLTVRCLRAAEKLMDRELTPRKLHRFRLKTKRFRDTLELFRPCYGTSLEPRLETLRSLQEYLGAITDCLTTRRLLPGRQSPRSGPLARLVKFLDAHVAETTAQFLRFLRKNLEGDARKAWWIGYLTAPSAKAAKEPARGPSAPQSRHPRTGKAARSSS